MNLPALRALDVQAVEYEGQTYICLNDPQLICPEPILLSPAAFFVATLFDGERDTTAVRYEFAKMSGGNALSEEDVAEVAGFLDKSGLLLSDAYQGRVAEALAAYRAAPGRPAALAGTAYPADAAELASQLDAMLSEAPPATHNALPAALIAPHIDYERGGPAYAAAYGALRGLPAPEVVFVFGVAHCGVEAPFVLTQQAFETPFGRVEIDAESVGRLAESAKWPVFEEELVHLREHSIELQVAVLARIFGTDFRIAPILCGDVRGASGEEVVGRAGSVEGFLEACRERIAELGARSLVVAAADLAHVGRRFGDEFDIDESIEAAVAARDREDLEAAANAGGEAFYASVMRDGNERRVCGLNCIYSALRCLEPGPVAGAWTYYGSAPDPAGGLVSFASVVYPRS